MRIAEINMLTNGSTGRIMFQTAQAARRAGHAVRTYAPVPFVRRKKNSLAPIADHFWWGSRTAAMFHYYAGSLLGANGLFSRWGTHRLIQDLQRFSPDVIHLHNLHGFCLNLPMLFRYIKSSGAKAVWTFHDCWPFTGHCPYFTACRCEKWKTGCQKCPQPKVYPKMYLDTSRWMHKHKKAWFSGIENLTVVTPSEWLAQLVKESFFGDCEVKVIPNGIDLSVFRPRTSDFRKRYNIDAKHVLLGVSFDWGYRKGLDVFIELSKRLDPRTYQIVLVGIDDTVESQLPDTILSIRRTDSPADLAAIYAAADLFVNPTREDNYPTVNMESIACGTPVLTFRTGGSPEIPDALTGAVVDCDDVDSLEREIRRITAETPFSREDCLRRAESFDSAQCFGQYVDLFNLIDAGE